MLKASQGCIGSGHDDDGDDDDGDDDDDDDDFCCYCSHFCRHYWCYLFVYQLIELRIYSFICFIRTVKT